MIPQIVTEHPRVANFPPVAPFNGIALVGEAPGADEVAHRVPFVGRSGAFLNGMLREVGIDRNACFLGNVCQHRPPANDIQRFAWDGPEIQSGIVALHADLDKWNPNIVVCLGTSALHAASCDKKRKVLDWRGSLFLGFNNRKCIASLHPAFVVRPDGQSFMPLMKFDLKRALDESRFPTLTLPNRELVTDYDASLLRYIMDTWPPGVRCSLDIEGGLDGWPCVSICSVPTKSITIAWSKFTPTDHADVLRSFARLMYRRDVPKVLQNSLYDNFVLSYGFGIPIRNVSEDTMLKGWEINAELPKALGVQASIWTREPFYKTDRKSDDRETYYRYCARDSAVTLEICNAQDGTLSPTSNAHYRKNLEMLNPLLYMELRGMRYDTENISKLLSKNEEEANQVGEALCNQAGKELRGPGGGLSPKRLIEALDRLGYEKKFKKVGGRLTEKRTSDVEALLSLRRKLPNDTFLNGVLRHRHLEGVLETLRIKPDADGRVRCGYNVVGTETGRLTCYTSPTGAGANLQTIPKDLRINYCADPGHDFFQCDLSGADGWTVAAHCQRLGDPTMMDDYLFGLKPAKIIALLYQLGSDVNKLDRESLANACRAVADDWLYAGSKVVQHGSNYKMGIPTMITNLMKRSYKDSGIPIYMEHRDATILQGCYKSRYYGLSTWHSWAEAKLCADAQLTSASGQTRLFFGPRYGAGLHDTVKEFLAHEPQSNTTWATNLAMLKLWNDPANRIRTIVGRTLETVDSTVHYLPAGINIDRLRPGALLVEPLHQVHDALCGQWPTFLREWAKKKVREWFQNTLTIAGLQIVIPFDGAFGPSWGNLPKQNKI